MADGWLDPALDEKWSAIRSLREQVTEAIEPYRREKTIRSSLEAVVAVPSLPLDKDDHKEIIIVSAVEQADALGVRRTEDHKCGRCWRHLPEVSEDGALCGRCAEVVGG